MIKEVNATLDWRKVKLGDCFIERKKSSINVEDAKGFGDFPFFTSGESVLLHTEKLIDGENIYIADGGTANATYYNGEAAYSNHTYVIGCKNNYSTKFIYYVLKHLEDYINYNYFQGTGLKNLQKKSLKQHEVLIPSTYDEQQRIADALTQIDDVIDSNKRLIAKYEKVKLGMMHDLFSFGIDAKGNIRSEQTHQFKDSAIGRIPVEWEVVELSSISQAIDAQPDHRTPAEVENGIPYVGIGDVDEYANLLTAKCRHVGQEVLQKQKSIFKIENGDIIFGKIGTIGKPKRLPNISVEYAISANVIIIKPHEHALFVYYTLKSDYVDKQVDLSIHATTQPAFGMGKIRSLNIKWPILKEQEQDCEQNIIANIMQQLDNYIYELDKEQNKLLLIRKGILSDLITGKVRI